MINYQDLSFFGASILQADVSAGAARWKLIEARHAEPNTEFGGGHHVFIEAVDEEGNKLRNVQTQIEQSGELYQLTLDKNLNEPGTNWPLFRGAKVFISMDEASDRVGPLHTERGAYKGGDWHHHAWYLVFQRVGEAGKQTPIVDGNLPSEPDSPGDTPDPSTLNAIREQAWNQISVNFNRDAVFASYARTYNLGAPLSNEYDVGHFRAQGFAGGIVYTRIGDWSNVQLLPW